MTAQTQPNAGILVRKYGGSSLASIERIATVARDIRRARDRGYRVVVVVSAMGKTTDELSALAHQAHTAPPRRELDMLLSVGERITMSLLSMALDAEGCPAISYTGSQCGIITDTSHTDARILEVRGDRVREALTRGLTVVVAGFQGVSLEKEITTLGRGGSDTTAVALAAALGAVRCEIRKDVDGVMTADPALVPEARRHTALSWEEMEDIAESGCGVVHLRAVEYARTHQVPLVVCSSFHDAAGTTIGAVATAAPTLDSGFGERQNRYRPLVMHLHPAVARLRLAAPSAALGIPWRDLVLAHLDPAGVIAEWLDSAADFRWEVLAAPDLLRNLPERLVAVDGAAYGQVCWQEDLACISLAGGRPDSWLDVQRHLSELLTELLNDSAHPWRMRADGSALRLLLPRDFPPDLPQQLHAALLPA